MQKVSLEKNHINVKIVEYKQEYNINYKNLNYEWLRKYFEVETTDEKILSNPENEIIDKKGHIFFALLKNDVIGTCTLMRHDDSTFEISKLCVTEKHQKKGVGEKLLDEAILKANDLGGNKIFLYTNRRLEAAYNLYKKKGFEILNNNLSVNSDYKRESIYMFQNLNYMWTKK